MNPAGWSARIEANAAALGALFWAGLALAHLPLLRLPYFWDEAGYFVPAALDCLRHGWLIPHTTLANGHPPLLSLYLALLWRLAGFQPAVTRLAMLGWAALALCGLFRLARRLHGRRAAWIATALLACSPVFFAQASLAHLDVAVAALVLWALEERFAGRPARYAVFAAAACMMKETAVLVPGTLALYDIWIGLRRQPSEVVHMRWALSWLGSKIETRPAKFGTAGHPPESKASGAIAPDDTCGLASAPPNGRGVGAEPRRAGVSLIRKLLPHAPAILLLSAWLVYYHRATGYWLGNPAFFQYNVSTATSGGRIILALWRRIWQLAFYGGVGVVTLIGWRARWRPEAAALTAAYVGFHSLIGGAVLARYLLPAQALLFLSLAPVLASRRRAALLTAACAGFLVLNWFWYPPYPFAFEDNLAYADFVRLHQAGARWLQATNPAAPVTTAWPATDELRNPDLGYVTHPLVVSAIDNFTQEQIGLARPKLMVLFSRQYEPKYDVTILFPIWQQWSKHYFLSLSPVDKGHIFQQFDLHEVFHAEKGWQWYAIGLARLSATRNGGPLPGPDGRP